MSCITLTLRDQIVAPPLRFRDEKCSFTVAAPSQTIPLAIQEFFRGPAGPPGPQGDPAGDIDLGTFN